MKILLTRPLHDFATRELRKRYEVEVYRGRVPMPKKLLISRIAEKEGLICYPYDRIDADIIAAGRKLRAISTFSVGYDHIDTGAAAKRGITVSYTPEVLTGATADLTMALLLGLFRRVGEGDSLIRRGKWRSILGPSEFLGCDISGKTLGILGMGRIGIEVARRAIAFDMKVLYHSRRRIPSSKERSLGARHVTLEQLFRLSDVVSIHAPHTPETDEIVDLNLLKKMKRAAFLVNTARGRIVSEKDLAFALKKGIISGAALDVFRSEPIGPPNPLTKLSNVVITPHIGSATVETRKAMAEVAVKNLMLSLSGRRPVYQVRAG